MEEQQNFDYRPFVDFRPTLGGRDLGYAASALLCGWLLCNFTLFGGLNLGFSIAFCLVILSLTVYLLRKGRKVSGYGLTLLGLCLVMAAGFARTDDIMVKVILMLFLVFGSLLGLCQLSGKHRFMAGSVLSLLEGIAVFFDLGFGKMSESLTGLTRLIRGSGKVGKNAGAIIVGLLIAIPVLLILVPLLISADAAFEGLLQQLPKVNLIQVFVTLLYGTFLGWVIFSYGMGLQHYERKTAIPKAARKGVNALTLNTVLCVVSLLYVVYLVSQLAYFVGGMAGILPEEYTLAQYARRGFFEMAWLCAINLGIMILSMALCGKRDPAPLSTRLLCLFLGIVTVFLVATASAKMFLYIGSYGLTRLRVLTQVIMLFLALTTVILSVWLFVRKLPYMKAVVLCAMLIGTAVIWVDVDTQVANYNVNAYLSGKLETVDVDYLNELNDGAVPAIYRLSQEAPSEIVAAKAEKVLNTRHYRASDDFRDWNYVNQQAKGFLPAEEQDEEARQDNELLRMPYAYNLYFYDAQLEALCVGDGYVCLRGWRNGSDEPLYCLCLPNGNTYESVKSEKALLQLMEEENFSADSFGNWIPLIETEFCGNDRFAGIRGRSIEEDVTVWYVLDMENNTTYGPYRSEDEYWRSCYDLKANPIGQWEPADII